MSSILTNTSAMTALQNLANTQRSLTTTQAQISSGLKVANASDNAAYWSISTTMKSDTGALSAVTDGLNLGSSVVSTATSALTSVLSILNTMKNDIVTAQTPGVDLAKIQSDITAQQAQLKSITSSAAFNGVNLLSTNSDSAKNKSYSSTVNFLSAYYRNADNTSSTGSIGVDITKTTLIDGNTTSGSNTGILTKAGSALSGVSTGTGGTGDTSADGSSPASGTDKDSILGFAVYQSATTGGTTSVTKASSAALAAVQTDLDSAIASVTTAGSVLGATTTRITQQITFTSALSDAITSGVGSLVDADMNVASTRLQALQTQQQLGIQALSIANQNSQLILKLFNG